MKVEELSFYFNPWTIEYENYYIYHIVKLNSGYIKTVRFNFNIKKKILTLLDDVIGKEIIIRYDINLKEERKLKLEKINESR